MLIFPRLYVVVDAHTLARRGAGVREFSEELRAAGMTLVQWRCKGEPQEVLDGARVLREVFGGTDCRLVMNDRVDLAVIAGFDGVHVGQEDLGVEQVRLVWEGKRGHRVHPEGGRGILGVSTHAEEQVSAADDQDLDYVAIGPVFATGTKLAAAAVVGLDGVRRARALTRKPLVAIGGITLGNAAGVIEAGADSVAVISGMFVDGKTVTEVARKFLDMLA